MLYNARLAAELRQVLEGQGLRFVFQPIVDIGQATILGYEALMRGPAGTALESPDELLRVAKHCGLAMELEVAACLGAMQAFAALHLPGKLFLNLSAPAISAFGRERGGALLRCAVDAGLSPARLMLELTEHERVEDVDALQATFAALASQGVGLALDDFGDGRSSLRLWAQLKPQIVKVDKFFVRGIHRDSRKVEVLRAMLALAAAFGTPLVAEGVEEAEELGVLRDLGCHYGQGYLFGRPVSRPESVVAEPARAVLASSKIAVLPNSAPRPDMAETIGRLKLAAPTIAAADSNSALMELFTRHPDLHAVAVVENHYPIGLVNRRNFVDKFAQRYSRELYGRRPCTLFMNATPLRVEASAPIDSLTSVLTGDDQRYLHEGFIITEDGRYAGLATGESLVRAVTERRIEAARHANPLTFLPGNIPITEHIRRLLDAGAEFAACYFDLNNFKPYNDLYGYWRGDEMIKLAAQVIGTHADPAQDFVGHVGGDDFVVLFQSEDWRLRCERTVQAFNRRARDLFDAEELARNGFESEDRRGFKVLFPLTTVAAGVVHVTGGQFQTPEEVASAAAAAKKVAKQTGSGIHVAPGLRVRVLLEAAG
ncbi:EAL domain-containing protein [Thauera sp. CAU 1555]|uniref:EAL domain-containing protein n=1 Tax=Thauera sedimentorum TaxID=2767595 RepID=A0ABR9BAF5_9RHOO|nr:EAL domain-containing protein [Thauera sedimentorum]MBC9072020.1 EAL domain-containing protein [Thauera sedimentorum]MBD8502939.1 EAL domain-containing protein [Thauera sedimentorum]